jgi:hypothetical protein
MATASKHSFIQSERISHPALYVFSIPDLRRAVARVVVAVIDTVNTGLVQSA